MDTMQPHSHYQSIVLMGKIASGKGTQADLLTEMLHAVRYSNGDQVRQAIVGTSAFSTRLKGAYESGLLIPEWIVSYWMMHALLHEHTNDQIVFEGVAKKPKEAELFHEIHEWIGRSYIVFHIDVSDDVVRERSLGRGRDVLDTSEAIECRLGEYMLHTTKSVAFFKEKGTLIEIDGNRDAEQVQKEILAHLTK